MYKHADKEVLSFSLEVLVISSSLLSYIASAIDPANNST